MLIALDNIPLPRGSALLFGNYRCGSFHLGDQIRAAMGSRSLPLGQADRHDLRRFNAPPQKIDKAGGGLATGDGIRSFVRVGGHKTDRVFPDEQSGHQDQSDYQAVQPVFADQGGDPGGFGHAEVGFVKEHGGVAPDHPGEQLWMPLFAHRFVAQEVGIGGENERAAAEPAFDEHRMTVTRIGHPPACARAVEI